MLFFIMMNDTLDRSFFWGKRAFSRRKEMQNWNMLTVCRLPGLLTNSFYFDKIMLNM